MQPSGFENYSAAGTVVVKGGAGRLFGLTVNTTANGTITLYDNVSAASGKKIATLKASVVEGNYFIHPGGIPFHDGLVIVLAAASDITVSFT